MLKFILILFVGLSNLRKTTPCVAQYGQCGGLQYTGSTDCCVQSICNYSNPWYSQCVPDPTPSTTGCSALYGQCGGQTWSGPTCCDYSTCTYSSPYYSQCLSAPSSATSTASTSSTSSSTQSSSSTSPSTASTSTSSSIQSSSSTSPSTSQSAGCTTLYSQCGGQNWSGATCCINSICIYSNPYYSQCLLTASSSSSTASTSSTSSSTQSGSSSSSSSVSSSTTSSGNDGSQSGTTTRYWDCCKASCGWNGKASVTTPVQTCASDGTTPVDANTQSGCTSGGTAYMCNNQQPWGFNSTLAYGYAAANIIGQTEADWCCACYLLQFTSGTVNGKEMIVQVTNTGGDLNNNQFDLQMPGGGFGLFNGCSSQFPGQYSWGQQYGGVSQRSDCLLLPDVLQPGCYWRFDWFQNADNPSMTFQEVDCPSLLTANTQCQRL